MGVLKKIAPQPKPKRFMSAELMAELIQLHEARPSLLVTWLEERNICIMLMMMAGMLRESELVALTREDVQIKELQLHGKRVTVLEVLVRQSKTDQGGVGQLVLLGEDKEVQQRCPVARLRRYLDACQLRISKGEQSDEPSAPLFPTRAGKLMSSNTPCGIVQRAVQGANVAAAQKEQGAERWGAWQEYGSHSLRHGGVTAARANGVPMLDIQRHGRWKSLTVFAYVGATEQDRLKVTTEFLRSYDEREEKRQAQLQLSRTSNAAAVVAAAYQATAAAGDGAERLVLCGRQQLEMLQAAGVCGTGVSASSSADAGRPSSATAAAAAEVVPLASPRAIRQQAWMQDVAESAKLAGAGSAPVRRKRSRMEKQQM